MTTTGLTNPGDDFESCMLRHNDLIAGGPVENAALFMSLTGIEATGLQIVGVDVSQKNRIGETLQGLYSQVNELEVVPPLNDEQRQYVTGKVTVFAALAESKQPRKRKGSTPTDPNAIPTDRPKP